MKRPVAATVLLLLVPLAVVACSSGGGGSTADTKQFCARYARYYEEADLEKSEALLDDALEVAPDEVAKLIEERRATDDGARSTELLDEIIEWRAAHCPDFTAPTTTIHEATETELAWCTAWRRYYAVKDDRDEAAPFLAEAVERAPDDLGARMRRYQREVREGAPNEDIELEMNDAWHRRCPGGVNNGG